MTLIIYFHIMDKWVSVELAQELMNEAEGSLFITVLASPLSLIRFHLKILAVREDLTICVYLLRPLHLSLTLRFYIWF